MKLVQKQIGQPVIGKSYNERNGRDMNRKTVRTTPSKRGAIAMIAGLALGFASMAQATVTVLTGGDPGEGYSPLNTEIYAYHFTRSDFANHASVDIIQGVTFSPFTTPANTTANNITVGNVNASNVTAYAANAASIGSNPFDLALKDVANDFFYGNGNHPFTITLSGLVNGSTYQLDLFWQNGGAGSYPVTYTINGSIVEDVPGVSGTYYDAMDSVAANGLGQITVVASKDIANTDAPYLNAFSLTEFVIPEPSTVVLLGLGGLLVAIKRRRVHA